MDHMDQEPLDFAAALSLLREAREEIKRLRGPLHSPYVAKGVLSEAEIAELVKAKPGPITVVYPLEDARNEALEEAAKVADEEWIHAGSLCRSKCAGDIAKAIRALISHAENYSEPK